MTAVVVVQCDRCGRFCASAPRSGESPLEWAEGPRGVCLRCRSTLLRQDHVHEATP